MTRWLLRFLAAPFIGLAFILFLPAAGIVLLVGAVASALLRAVRHSS